MDKTIPGVHKLSTLNIHGSQITSYFTGCHFFLVEGARMSSSKLLRVCKYRGAHLVRPASTLAPTAPLPLPAAEQEFRDKYYPR